MPYTFPLDENSLPKYLTVGEFAVRLECCTGRSACFCIGRLTDAPKSATLEALAMLAGSRRDAFFEECGWVDIHFPTHKPFSILMRLCLPIEHGFEDEATKFAIEFANQFGQKDLDASEVWCYVELDRVFILRYPLTRLIGH